MLERAQPDTVARRVTLTVNDVECSVPFRAADQVLADSLRDELGHTDVKIGCREGAWGACVVVVDGRAQPSCLTYLGRAEGADVRTPSHLADTPLGRRIVECLVGCRAMQCGYCTPGIVSALYALAGSGSIPIADGELGDALRGHLCRCTGYARILDAARQLFAETGER
ncbi:MAG: (2Fe-2S)-binding domain protein [Pseudonocardiales bacterium]|nr:(2Fe-2S)-binding domain protein [Pseudonocardiales bacterium]